MTQSRLTLLLVCLNALLLLPWLGLAPFSTRGEPREAIVAQSILRDGRWILPSGYGTDVPSKPPFLHWMIALGSIPSGAVSEASARLPSALAAIAFVLYFSIWVAKRRGILAAGITSFVLMTSFEWLRASQGCRVDLVHSAALAAGLCALYSWYERDFRSLPLAAIALLSVATLTKGPVALIISAGVFSVFGIIRSVSFVKIVFRSLLVFVPVIVISSIWYFLAYKQGGQQFWEMVLDENFRRFTSSMDDTPHKHGIMYLIGTTFLGLMPWSLVLAAPLTCGLLQRRRLRRAGFLNTLRAFYTGLDSHTRFCIIAAAIVFSFYCIPSSKRSVYVLAAYPFIAVGLSHALIAFSTSAAKSFKYGLILLLSIIGLVFSGLFLLIILPLNLGEFGVAMTSDTYFYIDTLRVNLNGSVQLIGLFLVTVLTGACFVRLSRTNDAIGRLSSAAIVLISVLLTLSSMILPTIGNAVSAREFSSQVDKLIPIDQKIFSFGSEFYATSFYINRPIFGLPSDASKSAWVLLEIDRLEELKALIQGSSKLEIVAQSGRGFLKPKGEALLVRLVPTIPLG